jgi:carbamoyl-phosphate synthase large subunit
MNSTVLVLGSGPIRIGQGIEFDYSCVHCVWALERLGYRAVIVNNNPETVSTDFDTGDGLYFEPVTVADVMDVARHENPIGVVCQFGGQTAINLAEKLEEAGLKVLGTSPAAIAMAEDRKQFDALLEDLGIERPQGRAVRSFDEAAATAAEIGYPVLVRPSFVLGGRAMEIVFDPEQLEMFYREAEAANPGQPVLVDRYIEGIEAEVDVISDGTDTLVPGIMEHIERAGVHSGDSMAVYPAVTLSNEVQARMVEIACKIARALDVRGLMNIQFVVSESDNGNPVPYVLEVNPRASRTVPYLSKVTRVPMVDLGTQCMMGKKLADLGYGSGLWSLAEGRVVPEADLIANPKLVPEPVLYAVKAPVFSFQKLRKVEPSLGPEMKSTGEILGIDFTYEAALYKALVASGIQFRGEGYVVLSVRDRDKPQGIEIARKLVQSGYRLAATAGTHDSLAAAGIPSRWMMKISEGTPSLLDHIIRGEVSLMINSPGNDPQMEFEGAQIRRACIETGVPCVTSLDTAGAIIRALEVYANPSLASCRRLEEYFEPQPILSPSAAGG